MGDRFTEEEVDLMLKGAPVDNVGNFDYIAFTRMLKHGTKDD
jgi:Ca2+-binding EF-hand superfamily protein